MTETPREAWERLLASGRYTADPDWTPQNVDLSDRITSAGLLRDGEDEWFVFTDEDGCSRREKILYIIVCACLVLLPALALALTYTQ